MLLACKRCAKGLAKVHPNREAMHAGVVAHPEVLAEAYQTILRRAGVAEPYELLKNLTRGHAPTLADLRAFVKTLPVPKAVKAELLALTPEAYTGVAGKLVQTLTKKM
jgi:adenylosuccinate lyase